MDALLEAIAKKLAAHSTVELAYLFGSQAKGHASKKSDIDIAILLGKSGTDHLEQKLNLLNDLQEGIEGDIDLTILNESGSVLKYQVVKNGKLIFEKKEGDHKNFKIEVWKEYFDFQPTLNFFYQKKIA